MVSGFAVAVVSLLGFDADSVVAVDSTGELFSILSAFPVPDFPE